MTTSREALQAILRQYQAPLDRALLALQGDLGALVGALEDEGADEEVSETNALGIYNEAFDLRLQVKAFFDTWIEK
jgi:5,10-methylenetetrahydrofolate reductase